MKKKMDLGIDNIAKIILSTLLLLLVNNILCQNLGVKLTLEYDNNVYNLSESENNGFMNYGMLDYIKSSDDFIQKFDLRLSENYKFNKLNLSPFIKTTYVNYINNGSKNSINLLLGINSQFQKLNTSFSYGYYPSNFIRKYIDTDGTNNREDFDYKKMMWRFSGSYQQDRLIIPIIYFKYEIYHHNKYFIEYDGSAITPGIGWRLLTKWVNTDIMYYYRTYQTKSDNPIINDIIQNVKDASYDANIYEIKIRTKRFYNTLADFRFYSSFNFEDRYYQSMIPLVIDKYHTMRNDKTFITSVGSDIWVDKNLIINLDFKYKKREVKSDYINVIKNKEYDKFQISTSIEYTFKLF